MSIGVSNSINQNNLTFSKNAVKYLQDGKLTEDSLGKQVVESALLNLCNDNSIAILRHDITDEKETFATFYEFENRNHIQKTYKWEKINDNDWNITEVTLYTNNEPYKKFDGTYENTIENYIVEDLIELLESSKEFNPAALAEARTLIKSLNNKNIYEILYDYQQKTGHDLLDKLEDMANSGNSEFGNFYTVESQFGHQMYEHIKEIIQYSGSLDSDSWLNSNREKYIVVFKYQFAIFYIELQVFWEVSS